jgi:protease-4
MTGDQIIAYPNTLTGSIGVFFGKVNLKGLLDKLGIAQTVLTRGQFSDIDDPGRPLTDAERAKLRQEIEVFYRGFVERVASGRKRPYDQVEPLAQGRAWVGTAAKQNGLVDELGGLDRAVELIKQKANLPASEKISLVTYPPRRTLWDLVLDRNDDSATIESMLARSAPNLPIRSLLHGGILRLMPYRIDVR